jgi:hypothetical protein
VVWGFEREWIFSTFGEEWRLWLTPEFEAVAAPGPSRADLVGSDCPIAHLLYSGIDSPGAVNDDAAIVRLRIYGALAREDVLGTLDHPDRPTDDPRGPLRGYENRLADALYDAAEAGRLRFERIAPPTPLPEAPLPLETRPPPPSILETTHFLELRVVNTAGEDVRGVACEVAFPSGTILQGVTGPDGILRLADVDEGGLPTSRCRTYDIGATAYVHARQAAARRDASMGAAKRPWPRGERSDGSTACGLLSQRRARRIVSPPFSVGCTMTAGQCAAQAV